MFVAQPHPACRCRLPEPTAIALHRLPLPLISEHGRIGLETLLERIHGWQATVNPTYQAYLSIMPPHLLAINATRSHGQRSLSRFCKRAHMCTRIVASTSSGRSRHVLRSAVGAVILPSLERNLSAEHLGEYRWPCERGGNRCSCNQRSEK